MRAFGTLGEVTLREDENSSREKEEGPPLPRPRSGFDLDGLHYAPGSLFLVCHNRSQLYYTQNPLGINSIRVQTRDTDVL